MLALTGFALAAALGAQERGVAIGEPPDEGHSRTYARRHALVIGIDAYEDPGYPDLGYAVADAQAVAQLLVDRFGFSEENVRLILNGDANKAALDEALEDWACDRERIGPEDLLVIFFAGHGVTRDSGRGQWGYLVPTDGVRSRDGEPVWSSLVGMNDLEDVSELIPAKHALFVLDCCFGGLAVSRAAPPVAAGLSNRARQVITAGNAEQPVLDTGGGRHSVFTGALLAGLEGAADVDADQVVTFGELFNHVGREVERKTEARQTPLQATFPDHEGGSVALFPPGTTPGAMTAAQRLKSLERGFEEQLKELKRLSDYILVQDLQTEAEELWPQEPVMVPRYRDWLVRARDLVSRLPQHEESVRRVRQEAYLSQVVAGELLEGEGTEPEWKEVDPDLRWRFETFTKLVEGLGDLEGVIGEVEGRLEVASTLWQRSIGDFEDAWAEACAAVGEHPLYSYDKLDLALEPQAGLVPLGEDPYSGLWEFAHVLTGGIPERDPETGKLQVTEQMGIVLVLIPGGSFLMGARASDKPEPDSNESPAHEITLVPYFLSKYEMTQAQWLRLTGENPSCYGPMGEWHLDWIRGDVGPSLIHPVENVTWTTCNAVLSQVGLILPTEAQWEFAARAGTDSPWWTGTEGNSLQGKENLADSYAKAIANDFIWAVDDLDDGFRMHSPVGRFLDNPMGLFDVHGNVQEWCRDVRGFYSLLVQPGDGERLGGDNNVRVIRGGCYESPASVSRSAYRIGRLFNDSNCRIGLRPARVITVGFTTGR